MYRTAASSIGGSKCHKFHSICSVAASRNISRLLSCGATDPCSSALSPTHIAPEVVNPLETRMRTLQDVGKYSSESGALFSSTTIDLEARGFAILRQGSSLPDQWSTQSTLSKDRGHRVLTFGGSKMSERKDCMFQRRFSSNDAKVPTDDAKIPVVRQLICYDDHDLQKSSLVSLRNCLLENTILAPISKAGLFHVSDLARFGNLVLGHLGHPFLRQLVGIVTVNLMRGLNVSQLIKLDNILWSPVHQCIVLDETSLTIESKAERCPYNAIQEVFMECVEISTGLERKRVRVPILLSNLLSYLTNAKGIDKRLITNHYATRFPWERIHRNSRLNQLLRQAPPKHITAAAGNSHIDLLNIHASSVLADIGLCCPLELLTSSGLHRLVDFWARQGQQMRGIRSSKSPIALPSSPFEGLRKGTLSIRDMLEQNVLLHSEELVVLGDILVALHRDPFEHLYQPLYEKVWPRLYTVLDVDQLLNGVIPLYGPTSDKSLMRYDLWDALEEGDPISKPRYCRWTGDDSPNS